jgi:RNA polymerase sigma-70 factor (ECF subfamily)
MNRLADETAAEGKGRVLEELRVFLTGEKNERCYPETARRLEMSEGALRVAIHRLRHRYRELLRLEIANTVDTPEAIDDEIRCVLAALA